MPKNTATIEPIRDYVLVENFKQEAEGDIIVENVKKVETGIVIAIGDKLESKLIEVGCKVYYRSSSMHIEVEQEDKKYLLIKEVEILAKVK